MAPSTILACLATFLAVLVWASAATWLLVAGRNPFASAGTDEILLAYEDRVAQLQAQLDRVASGQLLERDSLDARVNELLGRQAELETRQAVIAALTRRRSATAPSQAQLPAIEAPVAADVAPSPALGRKPAPVSEVPPLRGGRQGPGASRTSALPAAGGSLEERLAEAERSMRRVDRSQTKTLTDVIAVSERRRGILDAVLAETGIDPQRLMPRSRHEAVGGPFVPADTQGARGDFAALAAQAQTSVLAVERLQKMVSALPLARPTSAPLDITSGFGVRLDPFTRGLALHTGLDFRADAGSLVSATAPGTVVTAEYSGGYGNLVEVDHGNGVTTRYAHLSAIDVTPGDRLSRGDPVGRAGSTGRSTGTHLHYETRVFGEAVDPIRFLRAGERLDQLL
ncbi:M23 family metallopeptidase [Chelatococcus albus]|uniref:M23 family metallopeptidase n=1 Tax=Chelatococcus albus TaxID=3047466 RepID=UPI0024BC5464|nr:M23 family metallopeptidase [Chelatococcus sp. SYSU_G07232]